MKNRSILVSSVQFYNRSGLRIFVNKHRHLFLYISDAPASYAYRRHPDLARGLVIEARPTSPHLLKYKAKSNFSLTFDDVYYTIIYSITCTGLESTAEAY
jgi:hypothetical protein